MNRFAWIDPVLHRWSHLMGVPLYVEHQGEAVRTFIIVGPSGAKTQIWVEPVNDCIEVHVWDYQRMKRVFEADLSSLFDALDEALACARSWV